MESNQSCLSKDQNLQYGKPFSDCQDIRKLLLMDKRESSLDNLEDKLPDGIITDQGDASSVQPDLFSTIYDINEDTVSFFNLVDKAD